MKELDFKTAFKYPFNRPVGLLNILWILLPIIGWFAYGGYIVRIVKRFVSGKFKETPKFSFASDLSLGFFMFLKAIPFFVAYIIVLGIIGTIPYLGTAAIVAIGFFVTPMLFVNFINKQTIESFFEFSTIPPVFTHFGDYLLILVKSIGLGIIFLIFSIVLVGIPAGSFTKNIFFADFYRRRVK